MSELVAFCRWAVTTAKEDDDTARRVSDRVYTYPAPSKAPRPYIVIRLRPEGDRRPLNGDGGVSRIKAEIAAVGDGNDMEAIEPIADRIDALFGGIRVAAAGMFIRGKRVEPIADPELIVGANRFSRLGGLYDFWVEAAS